MPLRNAYRPRAPRRKRLKPADAIKQVRAAATDFMQMAVRLASGEECGISDVQVALRGDTGISKSHVIRELLADAIRTVHKAGNDRPAVIFVPRIDSVVAFECAAHAAKAYPEMWKDADRAQYARRQHGRGRPAGTVAWRYRVAGQGERPWQVYASPHMTAHVVQAFVMSILGPLAAFERAEMQPKGAFSFQSEATSTGIPDTSALMTCRNGPCRSCGRLGRRGAWITRRMADRRAPLIAIFTDVGATRRRSYGQPTDLRRW